LNLRNKTFALLAPLIISPLIILGWFGHEQIKDNAQTNIFELADRQIHNLRRLSNSIEKTARANIELLSLDNTVIKYAVTIDEGLRYMLFQPTLLKLFSTYQSAYPDYFEIRIIMPDGYEDARLTSNAYLENMREDESSSPLFKLITESDNQTNSATMKNPDNDELALYVFKPLIFRDSTIETVDVEPILRAYLVLTVDLDLINIEIDKLNISNNSQTYVLNSNNEIVFPTNSLKNIFSQTALESLRDLRNFDNDDYELTTLINKTRLYVKTTKLIDDLIILHLIPETDILASTQVLTRFTLIVLLITIVMTFIFIFLALNHYVLDPIKKLNEKTLAMAVGDFTEIEESGSSDEVGTLVNSFSKMTHDLNASNLAHKEAEEKLISKERLSALGQMAGTVAHDFNNLLTVVIGNLKLIMDSPQRDPVDDQKMMGAALSAAETASQLTRGLLTVSRKQVLHPESIDVNRLLHDFVSLASSTIPKTITFDLSLDTNSYFIYVDKNQIQNALFNLAINSRDAMPNGGTITLSVETRILETQAKDDKSDTTIPKFVTISLADTGDGMPPELINKVREPFFTTKGVGKGTGLGLSAVNEFVIQSDGKMEIISTQGEGTTVSLYLPLSHYKKSEEREKKPDELATGTETILVTDDEPMVRMVGVNMLKRLGYQIIEADSADNAIEIIESGVAIDLVFSDVNMPGSMDGHGLAKWVKTHRPDIKVVITSGYYELSDLNESHQNQHSITPVLAKPYAIAKLSEKIRFELDK
jgi:signal transduction histidine kinase/CheY-like chemotaxis protein